MITKFDRPTVNAFGPQITEALQDFARQHGLTVASSGGTFDGKLRYVARIEFTIADPEIVAQVERAEWTQYCGMYGLTPQDYGREFVHGGRTYKAVGFKVGTSKPLLTLRDDGQKVIFTQAAIDVVLKPNPV